MPHDRLVGHRQVPDAYQIAIARALDATVVSFDQGIEDGRPLGATTTSTPSHMPIVVWIVAWSGRTVGFESVPDRRTADGDAGAPDGSG